MHKVAHIADIDSTSHAPCREQKDSRAKRGRRGWGRTARRHRRPLGEVSFPSPTPAARSLPSDDDREFTLLKFYELNASAIKMLLDGQEESMDLPFTPGPKEHEIIHYQSSPARSILLMGRSGTGKTTCLVFRMWAQHVHYNDGQREVPTQLFLTKNDVLCREVARSFQNMGLAWRKRLATDFNAANEHVHESEQLDPEQQDGDQRANRTRFLTSSAWLDALDTQLPGSSFFTPGELEQRMDTRKQKDSVSKGVEELLSGEKGEGKEPITFRSEVTYAEFRRMWRKIRSGSGSQMDCTLVWREIKSFIKGSVPALQIDRPERSLPQNRFLSLDEYLALPRKQSRMDESQRREVYDLYLNYERVKKEGSYYDEADLVYNLAGRVTSLDQRILANMATADSLLPIDSLFVDEVQDFTQAELYILAKLCRDPNNLFLAGDTAQSIAVGVDFRFTDVRQIFYNHFGGIEPQLLQLSHNYRSHAGILRLAACVVELLYHFFSNSLDRLPPDLGLFDGPKPVIMEVTATEDLVLMLEGGKRETSRIEFGAHQVVIVRSEEAKESLPDEFGIDRDWVMTVQQAKGLEFDDVLLYNFFTDSPAKDLWRVVSSYSEEDIAAYYADATVAASGVQKYDWESPLLKETRHLDFDADQHKSLEVELKMLYTAITRARVNCFIAETNTESSRPMFNYFQRRAVVDLVSKGGSEGLSGVRVFGVQDNPSEWKNRGEYYLKNAEGDRQIGCLRLAAKCFERANEEEKKKNALALLSFHEMNENQSKKGKSGVEQKERLFSITAQLLEAQDMGFLDKAALCLLRTGAINQVSGSMFELYARIRYNERLCAEKGPIKLPFPPSHHEKQNFSWAGRVFAQCCGRSANTALAGAAFRNLVCAALFKDAQQLLLSGMLPLHSGQTFVDLHKVCVHSAESARDPIAFFQHTFQHSEDCSSLRESVKRAASIGCRKLYMKDEGGFAAALQLIPIRSDRIKLLSSIDESNVGTALSRKPWASHHLFVRENDTKGQNAASFDLVKTLVGELEADKSIDESNVGTALSRKPWASHHLFVRENDTKGQNAASFDLVKTLVGELEADKRYSEAAETLESRGYLLEAADRYDRLANDGDVDLLHLSSTATKLRVRWVELMLLSNDGKRETHSLLSKTLEDTNASDLSDDTRFSVYLSRAVLSADTSSLFGVVSECKSGSVMWQCKTLKILIDSFPKSALLDRLPGATVIDRLDFIHTIAENMKSLGFALRRKSSLRSPEENIIVSRAEGFFDLNPHRMMDPTRLETNPIVNLRLRESLHTEQAPLPTLSGPTSAVPGFIQVVDREKIHFILSQHVYRKVTSLLVTLDGLIKLHEQKIRPQTEGYPSATDVQEYIELLQMHMSCIDTMAAHLRSNGSNNKEPLWIGLKNKINDGKQLAPKRLLDIMLRGSQFHFTTDQDNTEENSIILKRHAVNALRSYVAQRFFKLPMQDKKQNIEHIIVHWRLLSFCNDRGRATDELHNEIHRMENHTQTTMDFRRRRFHYFINKSKRQIYPRLWLWAVESARDDILNSMSIVERMVRTSYRNGLATMPKLDQVSMLEVNCTAIFAALSLRYSEVKSPAILIPSDLYLRRLLAGDDGECFRPDGFGVPLTNALLTYCHTNFDNVFPKCVERLENAAAIILGNQLLSLSPEEDDLATARFERALHLGVFICCNAIVFSTVGKDMDTIDYRRGTWDLPSLPLQGNVRALVAALTHIFAGQLCPKHLSCHMQSQPATFSDLAMISEDILASSSNDSLVLCKLQQETAGSVLLDCSDNNGDAHTILAKVPFGESLFEKGTRSATFLRDVEVDPGDEDEEHGRKSDELNASKVIVRFIEIKMCHDALASVDDAVLFYRRWKSVIRAFVRRVEEVTAKNRVLPKEKSGVDVDSDREAERYCVFQNVLNPLQDAQLFRDEVHNIYSFFSTNAIVDSVECTYCSLPFDQTIRDDRMVRWDMEGRRIPWRAFAMNYNRERFGCEIPQSDHMFYHTSLPSHSDNALMYNKRLEQFATVVARIKMATNLVNQIVYLSDQEGQRDAAQSSWYLNAAELGRDLINRLMKAETDLCNAGIIWTRQPMHTHLWAILPTLYNLPQEAESFFLQKRDEEASLREKVDLEHKNAEEKGEDGFAPNSALNPAAVDFVPQFMM